MDGSANNRAFVSINLGDAAESCNYTTSNLSNLKRKMSFIFDPSVSIYLEHNKFSFIDLSFINDMHHITIGHIAIV